MKLLALDSSGLTASVAYTEDSVLRAEYTVDYKKTHSQTLLPMLDEITRMVGFDPADADAIAVSCGPGSFTGLRIGSSTAKGICLALGKPLIEVPTLAALAYNLFGANGLICPIMDARRSQVYNGLYCFKGSELVTLKDQRALSVEDLDHYVVRVGIVSESIRSEISVIRLFRRIECVLNDHALLDHAFGPLDLNQKILVHVFRPPYSIGITNQIVAVVEPLIEPEIVTDPS